MNPKVTALTAEEEKQLRDSIPEELWSIEKHGPGDAIYLGREQYPGEDPMCRRHGFNFGVVVDHAHQWPQIRGVIPQLLNAVPRLLKLLDEERAESNTAITDLIDAGNALESALGGADCVCEGGTCVYCRWGAATGRPDD